MSKPKVLVTRVIPDQGLDLISTQCEMDLWTEELPPSREVILEKVRGVDGILSLLTDKMDGTVMDAAGSSLKVISNYAVGFDNVDIGEATRRRIPVGNTPGVLTDTTADLAFALMIAAARRIIEGDRYVHAGKWKTWGPMLLLGQDIAGATLGILGFGRIGKAMSQRAHGYGMKVIYYDPTCKEDPMAAEVGAECLTWDGLLAQSDFLSIHLPLTPETHHMLNAESFRKMKRTAILVNTARGPIVDPAALYDALKNHLIDYAALDVTEPEPIPMDSPLLTLDNLIVVPHIGSASVATRGKMAQMAAENLLAGLRGQRLPNCANPQIYANGHE
jgi:glyoxylate reductase